MNLKDIYKGVIVPMITPLNEDLTIDTEGLARLLESFVTAGVHPFVAGTTGESASLSAEQKDVLVRETVKIVAGRLTVYAGISGNCLTDSIREAHTYATYGVDAVVATPPAYYPVNENQLERYFLEMADAMPCPLIIYNIPATTRISIPLPVLDRLSQHPRVVGIKDSERSEERLQQSLELWRNRTDFVHLIGWAAKSAEALLNGSAGIVPSTGNLVPEMYQSLYLTAIQGNETRAMELQEMTDEISSLYQAGRILSESIPALKVLLDMAGLCKPFVMPPMYRQKTEDENRYRLTVTHNLKKFNINAQ